MLRIKQWMDETWLKMNTAKTEFIYFGNQRQLDKCKVDTIDVAGDLILRTDSIKYLGVHMDSNLNFKQHITQKCCSAMFNFLRIKSIRHLLDEDTTESLCQSLCISHLDYCNSLIYGLPDTSIAKFQRIQNMCARLVLRRSKYESAQPKPYCIYTGYQSSSGLLSRSRFLHINVYMELDHNTCKS